MFIKSYAGSARQIKNSALLIEPEHYNEIMDALRDCDDYRVGKENQGYNQQFYELHVTEDEGQLCRAGVVLTGKLTTA